MSETPIGTDRVELTDDEFDSTTGHHLDCWVNEGLGTCDKDCTRLLHARCAELEEADAEAAARVQALTAEVGRLQSLVDIDHVGHSRVMEAERDAARAELAAANTRCAALEKDFEDEYSRAAAFMVEHDALQETLDRVSAVLSTPDGKREWHNQGRSGECDVVDVSRVRAALTPEGTE